MKKIFGIIGLVFLVSVFMSCNKPSSISEKVETLISEDKFEEAFSFVRPLARQGNAQAQYKLCGMYGEGLAVVRDYKEAFKWCEKAANQGNARAQFSLGSMYTLGQGVEVSYIEAYKWDSLAITKSKEYLRARDALEKMMTTEQIAEGKKLASEFVPQNRKN